MTTTELFKILTEITEKNRATIQKVVSKLSDKQLNWRPNPGIWSINEVLAHLTAYGDYYHPTFEQKIESTKFSTPTDDFTSSPLGRSAWKSMKLGKANNIKRKFNAPKGYNPSHKPELVHDDEFNRFLSQQETLLALFDRAKLVNVKKVKIPISISKIVRLRLGDALLFVVYHNERHIQQIVNLRSHVNFPKK